MENNQGNAGVEQKSSGEASENNQGNAGGEQKSSGEASAEAKAGSPPIIVNVDGAAMRAMFAASSPLAARYEAEYQLERQRRFTGFGSGAPGSSSSVDRKPVVVDAPPGFPVRQHVKIPLRPPHPPAVNPSPPAPASQETQTGAESSTVKSDVVYVEPGEDVSSKIKELFLSDVNSILSVCVCVFSGCISRATLRKNPTSTELENVEGLLKIIMLDGKYVKSRVGDGERSITGGLNVVLSNEKGTVIVGYVDAAAGPLIAASRVKVAVGSVGEHDENAGGLSQTPAA